MKRSSSDKHEFAIHYGLLSKDLALARGLSLAIKDTDLIHRIVRVLRLAVDDTCILFDKENHVRATITTISTKEIAFEVISQHKNQTIAPYIRFVLPLLKKEDMETAIYSLAELGVNEIQLVTTAKAQRAWSGAKEFERLERIIIAAAEQSKCYRYPLLKNPITFEQSLELFSDNKTKPIYFFDPTGMPITSVLEEHAKKQLTSCTLMIGPEGDLTLQEKQTLKNYDVLFCALTPTILRACQAAAIGAGLFRSVFK